MPMLNIGVQKCCSDMYSLIWMSMRDFMLQCTSVCMLALPGADELPKGWKGVSNFALGLLS